MFITIISLHIQSPKLTAIEFSYFSEWFEYLHFKFNLTLFLPLPKNPLYDFVSLSVVYYVPLQFLPPPPSVCKPTAVNWDTAAVYPHVNQSCGEKNDISLTTTCARNNGTKAHAHMFTCMNSPTVNCKDTNTHRPTKLNLKAFLFFCVCSDPCFYALLAQGPMTQPRAKASEWELQTLFLLEWRNIQIWRCYIDFCKKKKKEKLRWSPWKRERKATGPHVDILPPAPLFVSSSSSSPLHPHHPIMRRGENGMPVVMARLLFNQRLHGDAASQHFICFHLHLFPQVGILLSSISCFVSRVTLFLSGLRSLLSSTVVPVRAHLSLCTNYCG